MAVWLYRATDLSGATWWTNQFDPTNGALLAVISPTAETNSYVYDDLDNVVSLRAKPARELRVRIGHF